MNLAQMVHDRTKKGLQQILADTSKKRSRKARAAIEARLAEVLAYEAANPWIVA